MADINFRCPVCTSEILEEVMVDCVVSTDVLTLTDDEDGNSRSYGESTIGSGSVDRYQCGECGFILVDYLGEKITDISEVVKWILIKNNT